MNPNIDLSQLAVRRESPAEPAGIKPPGRHVLSRYVLPATILLGFLAVIGWAARDRLLPARPVTVIPVLPSQDIEQQAGTPLFTAAGWVEPLRFPVHVTALAEGVVERMHVVEGQEVKKGDVLAELVRRDAELALEQARADRTLREAELATATAACVATKIQFDRPISLEAALAEADAMLTKSQTELANLPFRIDAAKSRVTVTEKNVERKERAGEAISGRQLDQARSEHEVAVAELAELEGRKPRLEQEVSALTRKRDVLAKQLELRSEERRRLDEAEANCNAAAARLKQAELSMEAAQLRLDRMTIRAPSDGRILARVASEGTRLMGLSQNSQQDSSTVISLYDPTKLQVRADVRLEDVPRVKSGQPARIETAALPNGLDGEVLQVTSTVDIQKNTLQVKVSVQDPPSDLKPEMLVKVTFLSTAEAKSTPSATESLRVFVPRHTVESDTGGSFIWIADQSAGVARRRSVTTGVAGGNNLIEVHGLTAADKIIVGGREGLTDGQRITVTGEDHGTR